MKRLYVFLIILFSVYSMAWDSGWKRKTAATVSGGGVTESTVKSIVEDSSYFVTSGDTIMPKNLFSWFKSDSAMFTYKISVFDTVAGEFAIDVPLGSANAALSIYDSSAANNLVIEVQADGDVEFESGYAKYNNSTNTFEITTTDINGGAIDGTTIGAAAAGAGTFTTLKSDSANVSGDLVVDGTENHVTISTLNVTTLKPDSVYADAGTFVIDKTANRVGINNASPVSLLEIQRNAIGATQDNSYGLSLRNITASVAGTQQPSPPIILRGYGWNTGAGTNQSIDWRIYNLPIQTSGFASRGNLVFSKSLNGAAYTDPMTISTEGYLTTTAVLSDSANISGDLIVDGTENHVTATDLRATTVRVGAPATPTGIIHANGNNVELSLENPTQENGSYGRDSSIKWYGTKTDGTRHSLGYFRMGHYSTADDTKGECELVLAGNDGLSPGRPVFDSYYNGTRVYTSFNGFMGINTTPTVELDVLTNPSSTNTVVNIAKLSRNSSGTAAAGIGGAATLALEDASGNSDNAGILEISYPTTPTHGAETAQFSIRLANEGTMPVAGTTPTNPQISIKGDGVVAYNGTAKAVPFISSLTDNVADSVLVIAVADNEMCGGTIKYTIKSTNAANDSLSCYTGLVCFSVLHDGATYVTDISEVTTGSAEISNPTGVTYTDAWTITTGTYAANTITIKVQANSSIVDSPVNSIKGMLDLNDNNTVTKIP